MKPRRHLLLLWKAGFLSTNLLAVPDGNHMPIVVVFGRPGAGKTTVAEEAKGLFHDDDFDCLSLDLDICVPQWMKENFSNGKYPTLEQRKVFAEDCCKFVAEQVGEAGRNGNKKVVTLISFSFVNQDLRDIFRSRFPHAKWLLMDTSEAEALERIRQRIDHFYKGEKALEDPDEDTRKNYSRNREDDACNSEWKFAPVLFDHGVLDGRATIEENAKRVVDILKNEASLSIKEE